MNILWEELTAGLTNQDHFLRIIIRLLAAILLGGLIGLQREKVGKPAGLRTHTLVCLGTTVVLLSCSAASMSLEANSRVVQGIVTGIGFIGAGSILKLSEEHLIRGLTTSASIWTTAAVGITVGLGRIGIGLLTAVLTVLILALLGALERKVEDRDPD
jgi:putative Mg2+ transporter-C (MgtC) family protein